ncbi:extracellular solute-binding protein [Sciscionella marina]|uniref:extracellular solute-binding protein n=1 Tax=Sciscionella marina TaxID=508770 RepID=UPI00037A263D|nr:extracellular solute-binding protein [Sciscionella marina]
MTRLLGMTWNHPRGRDSLRAATAEYGRVDIEWEARSLREFEDTPVTELAARYDLIAIDHPFTGTAAASGALLALDEILAADVLADIRAGGLGASFASYQAHGHQWALPVDAAAQVSAYRPDLLREPVPRGWAETEELLRHLPSGVTAELPANPTHLWSTLLSLCHHHAGTEAPADARRPSWWPDEGIEADVAAAAWEQLRTLLDLVDPVSLERDPIGTLHAMASGAPIAYVPLVFGYSSYSRAGYGERLVRFAEAPRYRVPGTLLGGVGLAVSARCADPGAAAGFAGWVASSASQRGVYLRGGGQPGHRAAWQDPAADALTGGFFTATGPTTMAAFVRDRRPGYPVFQQRAAARLHELMLRREPASVALEELRRLEQERAPVRESR